VPKASLKGAILQAAAYEFSTRGYAATGVAAIANRASAPKGSFYNHFASKEACALEVLTNYSETRRVELLTDKDKAPTDRIRDHFEHLRSDLAREEYGNGCLFGTFAAEVHGASMLSDAINSALDKWAGMLAQVIAERRGQDLATASDGVLARFLVDGWEGAALHAKSLRRDEPIDNYMNFVFTTLLP
jgi:TetR/AcrR family transcriptional regulator, transcriptional repressor for nem operon